MSPETVKLLLGLLDQVSIQASSPNLEETAAAIVKARRELGEALAEPGGEFRRTTLEDAFS